MGTQGTEPESERGERGVWGERWGHPGPGWEADLDGNFRVWKPLGQELAGLLVGTQGGRPWLWLAAPGSRLPPWEEVFLFSGWT